MHVQEVTENFSLERVVPYFQPIMDLDHNAVWRYECLARLVTPGEQTFLPSDFLHIVERQQSVALLTETIFHRSAQYFRNLNVSWNINVSLQDMNNPALIIMLRDYLRSFATPNRISLEITSKTVMDNPQQFGTFIDQCNKAEVALFVDHFETSQSCIETILSLPVKGIKVAGPQLVKLAESNDQLLEKLLYTANEKEILVIAEHIEDQDTLVKITNLGINLAQGFYFCQPKAST